MNTKDLIDQATRTESKLDNITIDKEYFESIVKILIIAGNLLDGIKKNTFYDKPFDLPAIEESIREIAETTVQLKWVMPRPDDYTTDLTETNFNPRIFHGIVGIATESTELLEALIKDHTDDVNILEELFDVDWYTFILLDELNGDQEQIWKMGFDKLKKRYPEKFTNESANNRDLGSEREILESHSGY